jgi:hypothetical protein
MPPTKNPPHLPSGPCHGRSDCPYGRFLRGDLFPAAGVRAGGRPRYWVIPSLQFRVFRLGVLQNGNVWVGILPEREEVLVGDTSLSEGIGR